MTLEQASRPRAEGIFRHWPNRITAMRFGGALLLFVLFALVGSRPLAEIRWQLFVAFWLFVLVAATDFLDGWLARRGNLVSAFGRIADPFVDKVLIVGSMVYLAVMPWSRDLLPATVVVLILAREFLVTAVRGYVESIGREFPADWFGKTKMVLQCVAVGAILWAHMFQWPDGWQRAWLWLARVSVYVTLVATVGSGISYVLKTKRLLAGDPR